MINPFCYPASAIHHTLRQVNVGKFSPGDALHVDVDLISEVLILSFEIIDSRSMPLEVRESVYMCAVHMSVFAASLSAVY